MGKLRDISGGRGRGVWVSYEPLAKKKYITRLSRKYNLLKKNSLWCIVFVINYK